MEIKDILNKTGFAKNDLIELLRCSGKDRDHLLKKSFEIKEQYAGNKVYLRGLIELTNRCAKNCYYCGIRRDNVKVNRYFISDEETLEAARFAYENRYGSIVIQSGEIQGEWFIRKIESLILEIKKLSGGKLGITLSCGEQSENTYRRWFEAGAHRYLLRIETSNPELYATMHPADHDWNRRIECLRFLKKTGYQTGTGVMIGLPGQTVGDLANDLLFIKELDIDMCGMGPYIEHEDTPLYQSKDGLLPLQERFELTLKMIAVLRILMPDINIASTTALQAIDKIGREKALKIGANILMPNITPGKYRDDYKLYANKPCTDESPEDCGKCIEARVRLAGCEIGFDEWGDSKHYNKNKFKRLSENP